MAHILLAEDRTDVSSLMIEILELEGYIVDWVPDGLAAIDKLHAAHQYDILITDMAMPERNGIEVIKHAQSLERKIPSIIISGGDIDPDHPELANDMQNAASPTVLDYTTTSIADCVLRKPIDFNILRRAISILAAAPLSSKEAN